jgi:hypothetical protein
VKELEGYPGHVVNGAAFHIFRHVDVHGSEFAWVTL